MHPLAFSSASEETHARAHTPFLLFRPESSSRTPTFFFFLLFRSHATRASSTEETQPAPPSSAFVSGAGTPSSPSDSGKERHLLLPAGTIGAVFSFLQQVNHRRCLLLPAASSIHSLNPGDSCRPTIAAYGADFSKTGHSTLPKEPDILPSQSKIRKYLFEMENRKLFHFDTKKERLENSCYESISDEETDALPRFPFPCASTTVDRDLYTHLEKDSRQETCEWPAILEEANKLAGSYKRTCNSSNTYDVTEVRRFHKAIFSGRKRSSRFKYSIQSLSRTEDLSLACSSSKDESYNSCEEDIEGPAQWDIAEHEDTENAMPHSVENILKERAEQTKKTGSHIQHVGAPSVSELLENLQKTNDPSFMRNLALDNIKSKERSASSLKRTSLHLGNRVLDNKVPPELTVGDISSEDEFNDPNYRTVQIFKGHAMADLFQEAFKASTMEWAVTPKSNKIGCVPRAFGYHGRLQRIIQLEKERQMECLKQIQEGLTPSIDLNCINVKILSRTLEAKLTVCQCLFAENSKISECKDNQKRSEKSCLLECSENGETMKKTVIFSLKISSNVELEVGNIICLHPPCYMGVWDRSSHKGKPVLHLDGCGGFSPELCIWSLSYMTSQFIRTTRSKSSDQCLHRSLMPKFLDGLLVKHNC